MNGPVRTPAAASIVPMRNRSGNTIRKNCLVGYGTASTTGERALDSLDVAGVAKVCGAIQHAVDNGDAIDVYNEGDVVLESDGAAVIAPGDRLVAVAGAGLAASGRVTKLTGPVAGTNYEIVGEALTGATNVAGTELVVRLRRYTYQG